MLITSAHFSETMTGNRETLDCFISVPRHTIRTDTSSGEPAESTQPTTTIQSSLEHQESLAGGESSGSHVSTGREFYDDGYSEAEDDEIISDRLDFSSLKVQGREQEVERLHNIYNFVHRRGLGRKISHQKQETSVAVIAGRSGTGKSTLVRQFKEELQRKSEEDGGPCMPFFLHGKYDELAGTDPFSGIVEAFSGFAQDLMEGDEGELERIRNNIKRQLGPEATTVTAVVPGLRSVIQDESVVTGSRENARNKLKYIFQIFVSAISTKKRPVVLFLDDLQWCDSASLDLIFALLTDLDLRYFMFIGAYRSDEVADDDDLMKLIATVHNVQPIERIKLAHMTKEKLNLLVMDVLQREEQDKIMELTEVIFDRTDGNIFHSIQVLEELQRKKILFFSRITFQWEWELSGEEINKLLSEDVIEVVTEKIENTPHELQRMLILMAYTRSTIDVDILSALAFMNGPTIVSEELTKLLDKAVLEGLLVNTMGSRIYSFGHDRIQQAAYDMIPPGKARDHLRLKLGLKLYEMGIAENGDKWMLFAAADHLNATALEPSNEDPIFLIKTNLDVAVRASSVAAYQYAIKYLDMAKRYLIQIHNHWEAHYKLSLQVFHATAEAELCLGRFDRGKAAGQNVIDRARSFEDKLPTLLAICRAIGREERHKEAFDMSTGILRTMGAVPKKKVSLILMLVKDFLWVKRFFAKYSDEEILARPVSDDSRHATIVELLSVASYHSYYCGAKVDFLLCIVRSLVLSFKYGYTPHSGVLLMGFCLFSNFINDMSGAHRFSFLAREILTKTRARELECLQLFIVAHFVFSWSDPPIDVIHLYEKAYKIGMDSGDFENALLSQASSYHHAFVAGQALGPLKVKFSTVIEKMSLYNIQSIHGIAVEQLLPISYLRGFSKQPFPPDKLINFGPTGLLDDSSENFRLIYGYLGRLQLSIYFNADDFALHNLQKLHLLSDIDVGFGLKSVELCFSSLAYATLYRQRRQRSFLKKSRSYLRQLKRLCQNKGTTCWHRCVLMEAHVQGAERKDATAVQAAYDHAIGAASRMGYDHDAALGCQLAAEYCISVRNANTHMEERARHYLEQARQLYATWEANGAVWHLERRYPHFFSRSLRVEASVTEKEVVSLDPSAALSSKSDSDRLVTSLPEAIARSHHIECEANEDISVLTTNTSDFVPRATAIGANINGPMQAIRENDDQFMPRHERA